MQPYERELIRAKELLAEAKQSMDDIKKEYHME